MAKRARLIIIYTANSRLVDDTHLIGNSVGVYLRDWVQLLSRCGGHWDTAEGRPVSTGSTLWGTVSAARLVSDDIRAPALHWPNDEAITSAILSIASLGNVHCETLKAFTTDEANKIIERV